MVSFDVTAIFTSIPVTEAVSVMPYVPPGTKRTK